MTRNILETLIMVTFAVVLIVFHKRHARSVAKYNTKHFRWKYSQKGIELLEKQIIFMGCLILLLAVCYLLHRLGIF
jgi:hypothetical protein